jgi:hypothetical protein
LGPDHHQALAQFAKSLVDQTNEPALQHFDRLRRNRTSTGRPPIGRATNLAAQHT